MYFEFEVMDTFSSWSSSYLLSFILSSYLLSFQQDDLNVFASLSPEDYVKVLAIMKHAIIATDLALYFDNRTTLKELHDKNLWVFTIFSEMLCLKSTAQRLGFNCLFDFLSDPEHKLSLCKSPHYHKT